VTFSVRGTWTVASVVAPRTRVETVAEGLAETSFFPGSTRSMRDTGT